jgi:hypothetical protein
MSKLTPQEVEAFFRSNGATDAHFAKTEEFSDKPGEWLKAGQRVRSIGKVYDTGIPGDWLHAEPGEFGTVEHTEPDNWPTVRFDRTGTATCVTPLEVEPVTEDAQAKFELGVRDGQEDRDLIPFNERTAQYAEGLKFGRNLREKSLTFETWRAQYEEG